MTFNRLTSALRSRERMSGALCGVPSVFTAEMVAAAGFDYVIVDMQHGLVDLSLMPAMITAIRRYDCTPLVRVPANEEWLIMSVLDAGALGVIVPMVNSPEEAARALRACRYPPVGERSFGPVRALDSLGTRDPALLADVACIVMVETSNGLACVEQIAAVPGLDAIYVGPSDLAMALGLEPGLERPEPEHAEAILRIGKAAASAGIGAGIQCGDAASAKRWWREGFQMATLGSDHRWLRAAVREALVAAEAD